MEGGSAVMVDADGAVGVLGLLVSRRSDRLSPVTSLVWTALISVVWLLLLDVVGCVRFCSSC